MKKIYCMKALAALVERDYECAQMEAMMSLTGLIVGAGDSMSYHIGRD